MPSSLEGSTPLTARDDGVAHMRLTASVPITSPSAGGFHGGEGGNGFHGFSSVILSSDDAAIVGSRKRLRDAVGHDATSSPATITLSSSVAYAAAPTPCSSSLLHHLQMAREPFFAEPLDVAYEHDAARGRAVAVEAVDSCSAGASAPSQRRTRTTSAQGGISGELLIMNRHT